MNLFFLFFTITYQNRCDCLISKNVFEFEICRDEDLTAQWNIISLNNMVGSDW